jgi:uncharacterized protein (DUF2236 family)
MSFPPQVVSGNFGLLLHDDAATVTADDLEQQLELIAARSASPMAGVFGPASMTWRVNRESIMFLAAGRALLLQLAHPWVAASIAEHSHATVQPIARFHRTFNVVFALVFGTVDEAFAAARSLHRRHSQITGVLPQTAGLFKAGSRYQANNISALRWVFTTLTDSAVAAHELIFGPLSAEDRAGHYQESQFFAGMLGIPRHALPDDFAGLAAYSHAMCNSEVLTVTSAARMIADQIFSGAGMWLRVPDSYRALTASMLPETVRNEFGLPYGERERRAGTRLVARVQRAYSLAPNRLRYVGPYQEACQRLAGRTRPDMFIRLLNRLWIGRPSLAE